MNTVEKDSRTSSSSGWNSIFPNVTELEREFFYHIQFSSHTGQGFSSNNTSSVECFSLWSFPGTYSSFWQMPVQNVPFKKKKSKVCCQVTTDSFFVVAFLCIPALVFVAPLCFNTIHLLRSNESKLVWANRGATFFLYLSFNQGIDLKCFCCFVCLLLTWELLWDSYEIVLCRFYVLDEFWMLGLNKTQKSRWVEKGAEDKLRHPLIHHYQCIQSLWYKPTDFKGFRLE